MARKENGVNTEHSEHQAEHQAAPDLNIQAEPPVVTTVRPQGRRKGTQIVPKFEDGSRDAAGAFKSLANVRVNNAVREISKIADLGNRGLYEYNDEQREQVFGALKAAITLAETRFSTALVPRKFQFS